MKESSFEAEKFSVTKAFVTRNPEMPDPEVGRHRTSFAKHSHSQRDSSIPSAGMGGHVGGQKILSGQVHPGVCKCL